MAVVLRPFFSIAASPAGFSAGTAGASPAGAAAGGASLLPTANVLNPGVVAEYRTLLASEPDIVVGNAFHLESLYLYNTTSPSATPLLVSHDFRTLKLTVIFEASVSAMFVFVNCKY